MKLSSSSICMHVLGIRYVFRSALIRSTSRSALIRSASRSLYQLFWSQACSYMEKKLLNCKALQKNNDDLFSGWGLFGLPMKMLEDMRSHW
ncbi:hypothetical protein C8R41DRAFT_549551 [Lentinula lateritia]|uniref:Uncharacterized protein n=1 Tax=Lentinula lateritia TaxID=40482 RepID=A0ABQ8V607_9AGAR|nr:hypothetical protein C8R41DRAFT_549551 [Lentinula lateritia]